MRMTRKTTLKAEMKMKATDFLKRPYARVVVPEEDGSFRAEIPEFPGCIALADTAPEALAMLEEVAASWLESALSKGQRIPEPIENSEFSGKLVLRMPKSLHKKAAFMAEREGVSLNQFIVTAVAMNVGLPQTPQTTTLNLFQNATTQNFLLVSGSVGACLTGNQNISLETLRVSGGAPSPIVQRIV